MSTVFSFTQSDFTVHGNGLNNINLAWEIEQVISKKFSISKLKRNNDFDITFEVAFTGHEQTLFTTTVNNHNGFDPIPVERFPEDIIINANIIGQSVLTGTLESDGQNIDNSAALNAHIGNVDIHGDHTVISVLSGEGLSGGGHINSSVSLNLDVNGLIQENSADENADFLVFYDTSASQHKKGLITDIIPIPTTNDPVTFDAYNNNSVAQTFTGTAITVDIDTIRESSGHFTLASRIVTAVTAGTYLVIYRVSTDIASGTNRSCSSAFLELNTGSGFVEVPASRGYMYNRTVGDADNSCTVSIILNLSVGNELRIRVIRESGSDTINVIQRGCGITIVSTGSNGIDGATGPPGADGDITWQGAWMNQNYVANQAVEYLGSSYVCKTNTTANQIPTDTNFWDLLASKGDVGPTGSGSSVTVLENGFTVSGSPFEKINLVNFQNVLQNNVDSTQVDITYGPKYFGALSSDPVDPASAGDKYYNTVLNQEMFYDASRSKWLSTSLLFDGCGLNGTTNGGAFYRRFNGMSLSEDTGPFVPKGTLVAISYGTTSGVNHTFEVLVGGLVIASLPSGGSDTAYDNTVNVDFNGGKFSARNAVGSSPTPNLQGTIYYRLRA